MPGRRIGRWKLLVAVAVIALGVGYLVFVGMGTSIAYYITPAELRAKGEAAFSERLRLNGIVEPGSVHRDDRAQRLTFAIRGEGGTILVTYSGVVPDLFSPGLEVVIEGRYSREGVFEAQ